MKKLYSDKSNLFFFFSRASLLALIVLFFSYSGKTFAQCPTPANLTSSNLTVSSATVSWEGIGNADYYRLSTRELGTNVWQFATNPVNIDPSTTSINLTPLVEYTSYEWRIRSWCQDGSSSAWTGTQVFTTLSSSPLDCNGDQNGTAFVDSCGNCVEGNTGADACIPFSPSIIVSLNSQEVGAVADLMFTISQDPNEPDMTSALVNSDGGSFNLSSLNVNDLVGVGSGIAGGGFFNSTFTLYVDFIISSDRVILRAVDNATSDVLGGTLELENTSNGVKILSIAPADNNNITAGNSQTVTLNQIFNNPSTATTLNFNSSINSEGGDLEVQNATIQIDVTDCNGVFGGTAFLDNCGNCVGGNTGAIECVPFSPSVEVILADSSCSVITDLTILVTQEANEPDMAGSFFSSDAGAFDLSAISVGQNIGQASLSAAGGDLNFNANLIVVSQPSANQIIVSAINQSDGTVMGSFTISNNNPGIAIVANPSYNDGNNVTGGNVSTVFFNNLFVTPSDDGLMNFYSSINSELSDTDNQTIQEMISCPCIDTASSTDITACDSYDWNGTTYDASGVYTFTTTNSSGCDSTATLNLTINSSSTSSTDITACDSYDWNGTTYTTSGTYTFNTTNTAGCDSTATLNLTINSSSISSTDITACDSYDWNGTTYTTSGTYTFNTTNTAGCDSTATLNLTINSSSISSTDITACDSYDWNGTTYDASGVYTFTTTNSSGCDSTATLNLTINSSSTSSTDITACDSYDWNGTTYTTSGTYTFNTTNTAGCDSTATLNLTINSSSISSTDITACDSYDWNGTTYTTSGTYTFNTTNTAGCDSTATLNLTINSSSISSTDITACDSYDWNGTTYDASGVYTFTTTNSSGCDSTATLNLTINSSSTSSTDITACDSYDWNGTTYTTSGTYTFNTTNTAGCDSTATLNLTINSSSISSTDITACDSYDWNGTTYDASGVYTFTTTNSSGCDSTATLNLTINSSSTSSTDITACDSYDWNGTTYTTSGTYTFNTTNTAGCDSTATLNLTINSSSISSTDITACDSYDWNGTTYTTSGTYTFNTTNTAGCDSTATLNLTINNSPYVNVVSSNSNLCSGDSALITSSPNMDTYHWYLVGQSTPIATSQNITVYNAGSYYVEVTLNSCSTLSDTISISVIPIPLVTGLAISNVGLSSASASWDAVSITGKYDLRFRAVGASSWTTLTNFVGTSYTMTGLSDGTDYEFEVRSTCGGGFASSWVSATFTTVVACTTPTNVTASNITPSSATLSWDAVTGAQYYIYSTRIIGVTGWVNDTAYTNSVGITGLFSSQGAEFRYRVQAVCDVSGSNSSPFSSTETFTIPTCALSITATTSDATVYGAGDGTASLSVSGGFGLITLDLNGIDTTALSAGTYTVTATDASGCSTSETFTISEPPNCLDPTNVSISNVGLSSASASWDAVSITGKYDLRFRAVGASSWTTLTNFVGTSYTMTGLSDGTDYEFEVRSTCGGGFASSWVSATFTTVVACTTPTNVTASNITPSSATLSWDAVTGAQYYIYSTRIIGVTGWVNDTAYTNSVGITGLFSSQGEEFRYRVQAVCDVSGSNSSPFSSTETFTIPTCALSITATTSDATVYGAGDGTASLSVSGGFGLITLDLNGIDTTALSAGTYTVTATDASGCSTSETFTISEPPNCLDPTNVSISNVGLSSASASWDAVSITGKYDLRFRAVGASSWTTLTNFVGTSYTMTGLSDGTDYEFEVRSTCGGGFASSWVSATFTTVVACTTPTNVTASNITPSSATLSWDAVTGAQYYIYSTRIIGVTGWVNDTAYTNSVGITGLFSSQGEEFRYRVQAVCDVSGSNSSPFSSTETFTIPTCALSITATTSDATVYGAGDGTASLSVSGGFGLITLDLNGIDTTALSAGTYTVTATDASGCSTSETFTISEPPNCLDPTNVSISNVGLSSASASWDAVSITGKYDLRFRAVGASSWTTLTNFVGTSYTMTGLSDGTDYEFEVRSTCGGGFASSWVSATFTTVVACTTPTNVTASNITPSSATLSWDAVTGAQYYIYSTRIIGVTGWVNDTAYTNSVGITGLFSSQGAEFRYRVQAVCDVSGSNSSPFSSTETFTIPTCALSITATTSDATVYGAGDGTASLSVSGGFGLITLDLNGIDTTALSAGTYTVTATDASGCSTSETFTISEPPNCLDPTNVSISNVGLSSASASWDAVSITGKYDLRFRAVGASSWTTLTNFVGTSYTMTGLSDGTDYEFEVRSTCGGGFASSWVSATFTTVVACTTPTNVTASNITPSSATLSWDAVTGAQYYIYSTRIIGVTGWVNDTAYTNSVGITGLFSSQGEEFRYRVQAVCDVSGSNSSPFSSTETFTIPTCALSITATTSDATVYGAGDGTASLSVSGGFGLITLDLNGIDTTALSAGTYTVTATDASGCSTSETFTISEPPNCLDPTNVSISNVGLSSASASWDAVSITGKYDLRFRAVGASSWTTLTNFVGTSYTMTGLSDGTDYEFEVRSTCGGGFASSWVSATFTTVVACTTPTNVTASNITPSSATLSWDAVTGAQYYIYSTRIIGVTGWVNDTAYTNSVGITGLFSSQGEEFRYRVQAVCDVSGSNSSPFSSTETFTIPTCALSITATTSDATVYGAGDGTASLSVSGGFGLITLDLNGIDTTALSAGTYTVTATDASGCSTSETFTISEPPNCLDPTNVSISNVGLSSASASWDAVSITGKYDLRFRAVGASSWTTLTNFVGTSYTMTGLSDGTDYEFEVRSTCGGGFASSWVSATFTTVVACTTPTNVTASNITPSSATLSWDAVTGAQYYIYGQRIIGVTGWVYDTAYTNTLSISNLSPNRQVRFRVQAVCDADGTNSSPFSSTHIFNTESCNIALSVTTQSATSGNSDGTASLSVSGGFGLVTLDLNGIDTTALSAGTYTVTATDASGCSVSETFQVAEQIICLEPTNVNVTNITSTTAFVFWDDVSILGKYDVRYKEQVASSWITVSNFVGSNFTLNGLAEGVAYEFEVRSRCGDAIFSNWSSVSFTTVGPCTTPTNVYATNITTTSAEIGWDAVPGAVSYEYGVRVIGVTGWVYYTTTTNALVFSGLSAGRQVRLRVKAICSIDASSYSSTYIFNTPSSKLSGEFSNVSVFPNPTKGELNLHFVSEEIQDVNIQVVSTYGELVFEDKKERFIGEYTKRINLENYAKGIYIIHIMNDEGRINERVIIQ